MGHAFGMKGGLQITDEWGRDITQETRIAEGPDFDRTLALANREFERRVLCGPDDGELQELRLNPDYKPEVALEGQESRVAFERAAADRLNEFPDWRRGRLRDFVAGREVVHEWLDLINRVVAEGRAFGAPAFEAAEVQIPHLLASMPHVQVAISMKTVMHRNARHSWTANDITDIDALSVAFAYCEAVFTDKAARSALLQAPELRAFGTFVPRRSSELADWLDSLPTAIAPEMMIPHPIPRPVAAV